MGLIDLSESSWIWMTTAILLLLWYMTSRAHDLPPGPWINCPLLGYLPLLFGDPRVVLTNMRRKYGDIFHVYTGSRLTIVVCGYDAIHEALVQKDHVFSDRPKTFASDEYAAQSGITFTSGHMWIEQRAFTMRALRNLGFGKNILQEKIMQEINTFLKAIENFKEEKTDICLLTRTAIINITCNVIFGKRFEYDDSWFCQFLKTINDLERGIGNTSLCTILPVLLKLPGDPFKFQNVVRLGRDLEQNLIGPIVQEHRKNFNPQCLPEDYIDAYITEIEKRKNSGTASTMDYETLPHTLRDLFIAAEETTPNILMFSVIYFLNYPDIQDRCYQEIHSKIGLKPPRVEDGKVLPYVQAFILEVLRHADLAPLGVSHTSSCDTTFRGYRIPKGVIVIPFLHSSLYDPDVWTEPEVFNPDRFLKDGNLVKMNENIPFSIGRRNCAGIGLARMQFFLFLVSLVQKFHFVNPENSPLPRIRGTLVGLVHAPFPFQVKAVPRF